MPTFLTHLKLKLFGLRVAKIQKSYENKTVKLQFNLMFFRNSRNSFFRVLYLTKNSRIFVLRNFSD